MVEKHTQREEDERKKRAKLLIDDAINMFVIAREKHGEPFSCNLASAMLAYLRDREHRFTIADIKKAWSNPSREKNVAEHFFSSIIFPRLYACGRIEEETDALVASFLREVADVIMKHHFEKLGKTIHIH